MCNELGLDIPPPAFPIRYSDEDGAELILAQRQASDSNAFEMCGRY
jgi:hypothetical protein